MLLEFLGAAHEVTGSCHFLHTLLLFVYTSQKYIFPLNFWLAEIYQLHFFIFMLLLCKQFLICCFLFSFCFEILNQLYELPFISLPLLCNRWMDYLHIFDIVFLAHEWLLSSYQMHPSSCFLNLSSNFYCSYTRHEAFCSPPT